jgi:Sulfotransferase domain
VSRIIWLASWPKSGNTWVRIFVANLLRDDQTPAEINNSALASQRANNIQTFDDAAGVEASDLTEDEIDRFRPAVFRHVAENSRETLFFKVHDAYTLLPDGQPVFPTDVTAGAVYILRNPLDVAISFAHYSALPIDRIIEVLASGYREPRKPAVGMLTQRLLPWSEHVLSWIDGPPFPVHVVRYEDLHDRPLDAFSGLARFCGLPSDGASVDRAIRHSSFENLQAQERDRGFVERPEMASAFFREGRANAWRGVLSDSQVKMIVGRHAAVMHRFGYLPL